jgi:hypothetical protein
MTGLVKTEPIKEIREGLEKRGCILLDREGTMNQVRGFERAALAGFKKIAVTVAGSRTIDAEALRKRDLELGTHSIILAVHTTGISEAEALALAENCDLVWSCASRPHHGGKTVDLEPGSALFRAAGPAPGGPAASAGSKAAGASDLVFLRRA